MTAEFFAQPILNSPYACPSRHWEMDATGQPTGAIVESRRPSGSAASAASAETTTIINDLRRHIDQWRALPGTRGWRVTPQTAQLLQHWRHHQTSGFRPFFSQLEVVETLIWLTEVAPNLGRDGGRFLDHLSVLNTGANPGPSRLALKLAGGLGDATLMAMIVAWQTVNAVRRPDSRKFSRGFLIVTPQTTMRDRLHVLQPDDPEALYTDRELVPPDLLNDLAQARIVVTTSSAFQPRAEAAAANGSHAHASDAGTAGGSGESEQQMLARVMPELLRVPSLVVINDQAHGCYREKPGGGAGSAQHSEPAGVWLDGLHAVDRGLTLNRIIDLSATPFFAAGSGYPDGTLFPWTMSDFSLLDAIECGVVKLPRLPETTAAGADPDPGPEMLPADSRTALHALYAHYDQTAALWEQSGAAGAPCLAVICDDAPTAQRVYDYVAGGEHASDDGGTTIAPGRLPRFSNVDADGAPLARPRTILVDGERPESGDPLDTAGRPDDLASTIRCVVAVSSLPPIGDAAAVTHVLGLRALDSQLLCEQAIGPALRRQSYDLNEDGLLNAEYVDVAGIPFDFAATPVAAPPQAPAETVRVQAVLPERAALEIRFPRVQGYHVELPKEQLTPAFNEDSAMVLTPEMVGAAIARSESDPSAGVGLNATEIAKMQRSTLVFRLTKRLVESHWPVSGEEPPLHRFGQLKRITGKWLDSQLACVGGTHPEQLIYPDLAGLACERISRGIDHQLLGERAVTVLLDADNPAGSTHYVNFTTALTTRWQTSAERCPNNWAICDNAWEIAFCRAAESHPQVRAYVRNRGIGFDVPYEIDGVSRRYAPSFIVVIDDGRGPEDLLQLVVETGGPGREDAALTTSAMETAWVPGVNRLGSHGRWAFATLADVPDIQAGVEAGVEAALDGEMALQFNRIIETALAGNDDAARAHEDR